MPKLTQSLPSYSKHKKSGLAFVVLNHKKIYLGPHGTKASKIEYDRLIGEWLANDRQLPLDTETPITVVQLCAEYWRYAKSYDVKNGRKTNGRKTTEQDGVKAAT